MLFLGGIELSLKLLYTFLPKPDKDTTLENCYPLLDRTFISCCFNWF